MLGKTVSTSFEIVAWRGLRHGASKSGTDATMREIRPAQTMATPQKKMA